MTQFLFLCITPAAPHKPFRLTGFWERKKKNQKTKKLLELFPPQAIEKLGAKGSGRIHFCHVQEINSTQHPS